MRAVTRVRIGKDRIFMGKGVRELLDAIDEHKSIKKASEATGISYPKALRILRTVKEELGFAAVVSSKGGRNYGETHLSPKGREVLECYRIIENEVERFAQALVDEMFNF